MLVFVLPVQQIRTSRTSPDGAFGTATGSHAPGWALWWMKALRHGPLHLFCSGSTLSEHGRAAAGPRARPLRSIDRIVSGAAVEDGNAVQPRGIVRQALLVAVLSTSASRPVASKCRRTPTMCEFRADASRPGLPSALTRTSMWCKNSNLGIDPRLFAPAGPVVRDSRSNLVTIAPMPLLHLQKPPQV
jgi:hypothetical protein